MRRKRTSRGLGTVTLTLLITALFVATAVPALAHHPEIEATSACSEDGLPYINYVSTSWIEDPLSGTNPDIGIYVNDVWQASGAYVVGDYQFSGAIEASAWEGLTVVVKAQADAPWGNGFAPGDFRETTVTVPTDCAPDTASVQVGVGACRYDGEVSLTTIDVTIAPPSGATVTIRSGELTVAEFTESGSVAVAPGSYSWDAEPADGFELTDLPQDRTITTGECPPRRPPSPPPPPAIGSIGDRVWEDTNGDGHQGDFEAGIAGVTVKLFDGNRTVLDTAVTDAAGYYLFPELTAGSYEVQFLFPAGYEVSPLNAAAATLDSDAGANGFTVAIVLGSGATDLSWDAGLFQTPQVLPQVVTTTTNAPPETLPFTGSSNAGAAGLGAALLGLGGLTVLVARRREDENGAVIGSSERPN